MFLYGMLVLIVNELVFINTSLQLLIPPYWSW